MIDEASEGSEGTAQEKAVSAIPIIHQVFGAFADSLASQPERMAVAERLRKALITDGARTEATLRAALFEGGDA
jgi:hypothetical protein